MQLACWLAGLLACWLACLLACLPACLPAGCCCCCCCYDACSGSKSALAAMMASAKALCLQHSERCRERAVQCCAETCSCRQAGLAVKGQSPVKERPGSHDGLSEGTGVSGPTAHVEGHAGHPDAQLLGSLHTSCVLSKATAVPHTWGMLTDFASQGSAQGVGLPEHLDLCPRKT